MSGHSNRFNEDMLTTNPFYRDMPLYGWFIISLSFFGLVMLFGYLWSWMVDYIDKYEQEQDAKRAREARVARGSIVLTSGDHDYTFNSDFMA